MAENSTIEWTDHTFNPWIGCTKVSPGCDHCYAEALMDVRHGRAKWGAGNPRARTAEANWRKPLAWNRNAAAFAEQHGRKQRVFCSSLADVFDNEVDPQWRVDLFALIDATPNLDWLLLTKRVGNVAPMMKAMGRETLGVNVWLGATIVNRDEMLRDAPKLHAAPAVITFWSCEPLLGDVGDIPPDLMPDWIIAGGESGAGARPTQQNWVRRLRDQCAKTAAAFLFKQWGEWFPFGEYDAEGCQNTVSKGKRPGFWHEWGAGDGFSVRLGKKAAGRRLDNALHDGFPAVEQGNIDAPGERDGGRG